MASLGYITTVKNMFLKGFTSMCCTISGYAGGSNFDHNGGAAENLCLPKNPITWNDG